MSGGGAADDADEIAARLARLDAAYLAARADIVAKAPAADEAAGDWPPALLAIAGMIRSGALITPSQATLVLQVSVQTIRRRCAHDVAVRVGGRWYVSPDRLVAASVTKAAIDFAQ